MQSFDQSIRITPVVATISLSFKAVNQAPVAVQESVPGTTVIDVSSASPLPNTEHE